MALASFTRLRVRAWYYLPAFLVHADRSGRQAQRANGFMAGALSADRRHLTFWTLTLWTDEAAMRAYLFAGDHSRAMRKLGQWIDEIVPYQDGIKVTIKEMDDIGQDDFGRETIPPVDKLADWDRWTTTKIDKTGTIEGAVSIDVDDGTYSLRCQIRRWDETI